MSLHPSEREGRPLVGPVFLVSMGLVFAGVAALLHPDVLGLRIWVAPTPEADPVALDYLALEVERRPEDWALRRAYVRQLLAAGQTERAAEASRALIDRPDPESDDWDLVLQIELARARATSGEARRKGEDRVRALLRRGLAAGLDPATEDRFARAAREVGAPGMAARFVDRSEALDRLTRLERAARLYQEAGDAARAGERWLEFAQLELAGLARPEPLARAAAALEAVGRSEDARRVLDAWLRRAPDLRAALDPAIRLAWAAGELERAFALSERRRRRYPDDPAVLRAHVDLALARGAPSEGLEAARRWMAIRPGSRAARLRFARVAEWSGRLDEALRVWWDLARAEGSAEARREAERLARAVGDERILLAITSGRLARGDGDPDLVEQVVYLAEALGTPEVARAALARAAARPGAPKRLLVRLARLERRMGLTGSAVDRWGEVDRRYGTTSEEAVERAELAWRVLGPDRALGPLRERDLEDDRVVELVADLAWRTGDRALALRAHRVLAERGRLEPWQAIRFMVVLKAEGRVDEALRVARAALERNGTVEILLRALELAIATGRPEAGDRLLEVSREAERSARALLAYWRLRAQLATALGRDREARSALEEAIALDPGSRQAQVDLLWLLIAIDDRPGLRRWVRRLQAAGIESPALWPALGAALVQLGRDREALRWFALHAGTQPEDWRFWLDYAGALERSGRGDAAYRLRRYALRKIPADAPLGRLVAGVGLLDPAELTLEARRLVRDPEMPVEARRAAAGILLEAGEVERAHLALARASPTDGRVRGGARVAWHDARLALALAERDRGAVRGLLAHAPEGASPLLLAEGWALLERYDRALALALQSRVDGRGGITRRALARYLSEEARRRPREVHARARLDRLGTLDRIGGAAIGRWSEGRWGSRVEASFGRLTDRPGRDLGLEVEADARLALELERRWARGAFVVGLGAQAQVGGPTLPQAVIRVRQALDRRIEVFLRATLFEVVPETPLLYTLGARERLGGGIQAGLAGGWSLFAGLDLEHHHDRAGATLGWGVLADLRVARGFGLGSGARLEVYGGGRGLLRDAVDDFGPELASLAALGLAPDDVLPTEFLTAGIGVSLARGDLGAIPDPLFGLRYFVGAWGGWQWPLDRPAYRFEAGLGLRLLGPDELYLRGTFGNVLGGLEDVQASAELGYRWRL